MSDLRAQIARHIRLGRPADPRPFPTRSQVARQRRAIAAAGMRALPYPFSSALALTSDCDFTSRPHHSAYVGELVERHGLDFGDSLWLAAYPGIPERSGPGLAVLGPDFRLDARHFERERGRQLDPWEVLRGHHRGNIDHWHSFHMRGPRVFVLREWTADPETGCLRAAVGAVESEALHFHGLNFPVMAATLVVDPELDSEALAVELVARDGRRQTLEREHNGRLYRFLDREVEEGGQLFFTWRVDVLDRRQALFLEDLVAVEIRSVRGPLAADALRALHLHNLHTEVILDRLEFLDRELHFSTNLSTMHSLWHFFTHDRLRAQGKRVAALLNSGEADGKTLHAAADLPGARFSTVADDPLSFARVLPEITERFGIVHMRLVQGSRYVSHSLQRAPLGERHCSLHDLVHPMRTRTGSALYNLCAAFPAISPEEAEALGADPNRSRTRDFGLRLQRVLEDLDQVPGELAVLYTHLGVRDPDRLDADDSEDPPPRLEDFGGPAVVELKDRVFGVSSSVGESSRIWFTRASVLANYALMAQAVPERIARPTGNTVRIESRVDPVLERRLPESARALYGLTFYVDDRSAARVFLDRREIRDLARNPPDSSGRESVTIAECGIRCVLFDEVDPVRVRRAGQAGGHFRIEGGEWSWRTEPAAAFRGSGYGVLRLAGAPAGSGHRTARLELSCSGLEPVGCQQLAWALRRSSPQVAAAVLLETATGGRFLFGDRALLGAAGDPTARYLAAPAPADRAGWERIVVPFASLDWASGSDPADCPMPSHPPRRIALLVSGRPGEAAGFDALEFGRPKVTRPRHAGDTIVLGGRVVGGRAGTRVGLLRLHGEDADEPAIATTDGLGGFWLRDLAPGAYRIATAEPDGSFDWARATWVEASTDRFDLELEPAGPSGP